jgi:hypothetical protein
MPENGAIRNKLGAAEMPPFLFVEAVSKFRNSVAER